VLCPIDTFTNRSWWALRPGSGQACRTTDGRRWKHCPSTGSGWTV